MIKEYVHASPGEAKDSVRFVIDYGELHFDTNAGRLVGRALVTAHQLEANQRWAGGALTPAAMATSSRRAALHRGISGAAQE